MVGRREVAVLPTRLKRQTDSRNGSERKASGRLQRGNRELQAGRADGKGPKSHRAAEERGAGE